MPSFDLVDVVSGSRVTSEDLHGSPVLVMFLCAHCPYVVHVEEALSELARDLEEQGVRVVGIASNDPEAYSQDSPEGLRDQAARNGWTFPYLFDESQDVARAFVAACTPDPYLFDANHELFYRGRLCASRPGSDVPVTCGDLRAAATSLLAGAPVEEPHYPSLGCGIKWR
jgi:peroxiredoxin